MMTKHNLLEHLDWDSRFFDKRIGRVELNDAAQDMEAVSRIIAESDLDLVYLFVLPGVAAVDEVRSRIPGAVWVDGKITYYKHLLNVPADPHPQIYSVSEPDEALYALALQTGEYSRFNTDPRFGNNAYKELYREWLRKSLDRTLAREVFVYEEEGRKQGMVTVGEKGGRADIGLIGVDAQARGKGIASLLIRQAEQYALAHYYNEIQVVTQQLNTPACRLYEKCGFTVDSLVNIFHIWKTA